MKLVDILNEEQAPVTAATNVGLNSKNANRPRAPVTTKNQQQFNQKFNFTPQEIQELLNPQHFTVVGQELKPGCVQLVILSPQLVQKIQQMDPRTGGKNDFIENFIMRLQQQYPAEVSKGIFTALDRFAPQQAMEIAKNMGSNFQSLFGGVHFGPQQTEKEEVQQTQQQMPGIRKAQQQNFQQHGAGPDPFADFEPQEGDEEEIEESLSLKGFFRKR